MAFRVAINGYGRIGQSVLRAVYECGYRDQLQVVAINELSDIETVTYLTRYDTTHGRFPLPVAHNGRDLLIDGDEIRVLNQAEAGSMPWQEMDVDLVLECSGSFSDRLTAQKHLDSGARRLLFSQPAEADVDATIIYGFNQQLLAADQTIVAAGSCSTNCIVPILNLLHRELNIISGVTTTIHSAMNDQPVIDSYNQTDLRLTRSAMQSIIPVNTGLNRGIDRLLPELAGRFESLHVRVPTINVSLLDISLNVSESTSAAQVNEILRMAAEGPLRGLLGYTEEAHASVDFNRDARSGIVDGTQTRVSGGKMIKLMCWFDNEWGFANRMLDVAQGWLNIK
ncbi:glyceraldehyde 3-phosphate dehydrogenase NAD-binding domain-containing protein [Amphritea sp. 2_MG-2023]|uniref:glyceraldehyde 3-phosphate dehydrogenase NAD-binding domain-containing protein n=1 Tax=Amphritea TaxID=515417 RepID=UPI001C06A213|nr:MULTISPECIES: glyceraldehyde 3-phosphate dehydrogenase NAD-binding domain-containing protein [Amphritea]MBU2965679.1 erythrose-4-phosphate dehydrogenase [Amphritea atlantica]MDO6417235.1 glyceraldehyde 3-phosphate dehydrogenase NAD-binding domain-containing protein [Amphritea sp. 2_MG-2023]MDX2423926.1 glyceraldehyde 3-phosphate dehydrogenase NAD-binding domain-containing protein [Amphritea sp.]